MNRLLIFLVCWFATSLFAQQSSDGNSLIRFRTINILVDSGNTPLAAYQLECFATNGIVKITGIEGGEHSAFSQAPHYDPKAMQHDRVIIAAFNTAPPNQLPTGKTRVATVHVAIYGNAEPEFNVRLVITAKSDGAPIHAKATIETLPAK